MTAETRLELTDAPGADDCHVVINGMAAFNGAFAELKATPLAVFARDGSGKVAGGLLGRTSGGWLAIDVFWLPEDLRGKGVGSEIIAMAEAEARRRDCIGAQLNTGSFQAPGFYQKLGYRVFGIIDDYPPGFQRLSLSKRWDAAGAA